MATSEEIFLALNLDTGAALPKLAKLRQSLQTLKTEQQRLNKELKAGTISEAKFAQVTARNELAQRRLRQEYRQVQNATANLTTFSDRLKNSFKTMAKQALLVFGAGAIISKIGRVVGEAVQVIKDFEQANANLAAVSGFTASELKKLEAQQLQLGATTSFTAAEVAGLNLELAKLGFTSREIENMTAGVLDLAAATGSELGRTAEVVGATLRQFGLDAAETTRVVDLMQNSFSNSALNLEAFALGMSKVGPTAAAAGLSLDRVAAQLGVISNRGIDASTAGTGLRNIFLELSKRGLSFEDAMKKINTATDKNAQALELFGKRGATIGVILAETGAEVETLTGKLSKQGTAQDAATKQLDTWAGQQKITKSAYEGMILSIDSGNGVISQMGKSWEKAKQSVFGFLTVTEEQSDRTRDSMLELNLLTQAVIAAEQGTKERTAAIEELNAEYPNFLKNLDAETASNIEIAESLAAVNENLLEQIRLERLQEKRREKANDIEDIAEIKRDKFAKINARITTEIIRQGLEVETANLSLEKKAELLDELNSGTTALIKTAQVAQFLSNPFAETGIQTFGQAIDEVRAIEIQLAIEQGTLTELTKRYQTEIIGTKDVLADLRGEMTDLQSAAESLAGVTFIPESFAVPTEIPTTIKGLRDAIKRLKEEVIELDVESDRFQRTNKEIEKLQAQLDKISGKKRGGKRGKSDAEKAAEKAEKARIKEEEERAAAKLQAQADIDAIEIQNIVDQEARKKALAEAASAKEIAAIKFDSDEENELRKALQEELADELLDIELEFREKRFEAELKAIEAQAKLRAEKIKQEKIKAESEGDETADSAAEIATLESEQQVLDAKLLLLQDHLDAANDLTIERRAELNEEIILLNEELQTNILEQNQATADAEEAARRARFELAKERALEILNVGAQAVNALGALQDARLAKDLAAAGENEELKQQLREDAFEKNKKIQVAGAIISGFVGVINTLNAATVLPEPFGTILKGVLIATQIATTAANIGKIKNTQFGRGGLIEGPSHAQGGVNIGSGNEAEGGEAIINAKSTAMFMPALDAINSFRGFGDRLGTGRKIMARGGIVTQDAVRQAQRDGDTQAVNDAIQESLSRPIFASVTELRDVENKLAFSENQNSL